MDIHSTSPELTKCWQLPSLNPEIYTLLVKTLGVSAEQVP
jgi:hypothetical protein